MLSTATGYLMLYYKNSLLLSKLIEQSFKRAAHSPTAELASSSCSSPCAISWLVTNWRTSVVNACRGPSNATLCLISTSSPTRRRDQASSPNQSSVGSSLCSDHMPKAEAATARLSSATSAALVRRIRDRKTAV